ncbi:hypothetical protein GIB67_007629 [Kingdonia uniflora]|uniref:EXPERA domain-containing protein n=1 Tax=Kingdonia uniflora TaxID=39325 RepID=A0A7J7N244_9MAGN|nr:hypothetical protein GIB67_007629 [Kingdonia uniflora]
MGLSTLIDTILFLFFLFIAIVAPLFDAQTCLPSHFFPDFLIDLKTTYARDNGDYLIAEKPNFFIGLIWLELLVQWPLSIANVYGILQKKSWLQTTCLIYGVCTVTAMVCSLPITRTIINIIDKSIESQFPGIRNYRLPSERVSTSSDQISAVGIVIKTQLLHNALPPKCSYNPIILTVSKKMISIFCRLSTQSADRALQGSPLPSNTTIFRDALTLREPDSGCPWGSRPHTPDILIGVPISGLALIPCGCHGSSQKEVLHLPISCKVMVRAYCLVFRIFLQDHGHLEVAILSELVRSRKASDKLLMIYGPFLGLGLLATLRGIIPCSLKTASSNVTRSGAARKKRA